VAFIGLNPRQAVVALKGDQPYKQEPFLRLSQNQMSATIEKMLQQQIDIIQDLAKAMKDVIDACEFYTDQNEDLNMRIFAYQEEFAELEDRIDKLQGENFKLRKTIWKLKNDCKCE
jgi:predicted nuclease with TOPRIM domain